MDVYLGGTWASPSSAEVYIGGAWRTVVNFTPPTPAPPGGGDSGGGGGGSLSLSLSTTTLSATGRVLAPATLRTGNVTVTPSGGLAPYAYAWSFGSTDTGPTYSLSAPTFAVTSVSASGLPNTDTDYIAEIHCVVTDSLGVTATSATVTADFYRTAPSGGA